MTSWDNRQYLKFADERTRAAQDLLARVPLQDAKRVVDLGCGPGNSTALLKSRWPEARFTGVDSSADMLSAARRDMPDIEWLQADVATWQAGEPVDLLFANAVLQWLPDHEALFPALLKQLPPGGVLALQMPCNADEPSHRLMRELPGPWSSRTATLRDRSRVASASEYYDLLAPAASRLDVWQTTYEHVMPDAAAIVEWVKGTGLRPYLDVLAAEEREPYLAAYLAQIELAYPPRSDGKRLFHFPRLFVVATR
jgi:trans-aconitate 2-methyltransferase